MLEINTVLVKVASRCNINCSYCYVYNMGDMQWASMPKHISHATIVALSKNLKALADAQGRRFAVVLHGGEPLLLGYKKLSYLLLSLRKILSADYYPLSIQTNGICITDDILDLCSEHRVSLSVSIDGPQNVNDRHRIDHLGRGTYARIIRGIQKLRDHLDSEFLYAGILSVIDPESDPSEVYSSLKDLDAPSIDFLYRDGNHTELPPGKKTVRSTEYGQWLVALLGAYLADPNPPRIRFLDDMIKLVLGGYGTKEGLGFTDYGIIIIDTDGSISKNDTLKSSYNGADRFSQPCSIHAHNLVDILDSPEFSEYHALQRPTASSCLSCPELKVCGGGMPLHRWSKQNGYDNPSVYCADQMILISQVRHQIGLITGEKLEYERPSC